MMYPRSHSLVLKTHFFPGAPWSTCQGEARTEAMAGNMAYLFPPGAWYESGAPSPRHSP